MGMPKQLRHKSWNPKLKRFQGLHSSNAEKITSETWDPSLKFQRLYFATWLQTSNYLRFKPYNADPEKFQRPHTLNTDQQLALTQTFGVILKIFREHNHTPLRISDAKHGICTLREIETSCSEHGLPNTSGKKLGTKTFKEFKDLISWTQMPNTSDPDVGLRPCKMFKDHAPWTQAS